MARSIPALVRPEILVWARESSHISIDLAAARLKIEDHELIEWETGNSAPSIAKLRELADTYKRPLASFFLSEPPPIVDVVKDFRRLHGSQSGSWSTALAGAIRRAESQRIGLLEVLEIQDETPSSLWRIASQGSSSLPRAMRTLLAENSLTSRPSASGKPTDWFIHWSSALEQVGILVITTSGVAPTEARGFSLYNEDLPVIAVNGSEHFNGRIFSLMHEYAHLLLNSSGLCDFHEKREGTDVDALEVECNRIASEILLPPNKFKEREIVRTAPDGFADWSIHALRDEARHFGVSPEVILRRLLALGKTTSDFYKQWRSKYNDTDRMNNGTDPRDQSPGGDGLRTKTRDLGKGYVRAVVNAHRGGFLSTYETSNLLNAKTSQIDQLYDRARIPGAS